jgi:hypothetical protein
MRGPHQWCLDRGTFGSRKSPGRFHLAYPDRQPHQLSNCGIEAAVNDDLGVRCPFFPDMRFRYRAWALGGFSGSARRFSASPFFLALAVLKPANFSRSIFISAVVGTGMDFPAAMS